MNVSNSTAALTVAQVMTPDPIVLTADQSLQVAARVLEEQEISGAPVIDTDGALLGVLSEYDLVRARSTEGLWERWPGLTVRHLTHAPALTADLSMGLSEAAALMEQAHVHRLVVVDDDQQTPIGIISSSDIVRAILGEHDAG